MENKSNKNENLLVDRYKEMLEKKVQYYFDVEEFEEIIDSFLSINLLYDAYNVVQLAIKQHPKSVEIQLRKAHIMIEEGRTIESLRLLTKLQKISSSDLIIYLLKGAVYISMGDIENAEQEITDMFKITDEDEIAYYAYNIGIAYQKFSYYDLALKYLNKSLKAEEDKWVFFDLANCYNKLKKYDLSTKYYNKYLDEEPYDEKTWYTLGLIYYKNKKYDEAVDSFDFSLAIDDKFINALFYKGLTYIKSKEFDKAIVVFKDYLLLDENSEEAHYYIGKSYYILNNHPIAYKHFSKALELDFMHADSWYGKSIILLSEKKYSEALHSVMQALKVESENGAFWNIAGIIYTKMKKFNEAERALKKAIFYNDKISKYWISYASLKQEQRLYTKQIMILKEAYNMIPDSAEINYNLAAILLVHKKEKKAIFHLEKALNINNNKKHIFNKLYTNSNNKVSELLLKY